MPQFTGPTGWIEDPPQVEAVTARLDVLQGGTCSIGNKPQFHGACKRAIQGGRTHRLLSDSQLLRVGHFDAPMFQRRGTCTGNANGGAMEDTLGSALTHAGEFGTFTEISWEPDYAGARVEIGGGRISGDGAVVAWLAEFKYRHGWCPRGVYGGHDLSKYNEAWAVKYAAPGMGVPKAVMDAYVGKCVVYRVRSAEDIADALESKCGVIFGGRKTFGDKGSNGQCRMNVPSNHSTKVFGWFKRSGGKIGLIGRQSWGPNRPSGPDVLTMDDGTKVDLPDGAAPVPSEDYDWCLNNGGEAWAYQVVHGSIPR